MYIPKRYGKSRVDKCPFCSKTAITENSQGVPVCLDHKNKIMQNIKCLCGTFLEIKKGKWGPYGYCINCGNINFRRVLEINKICSIKKNSQIKANPTYKTLKETKTETVIRSDELDFYF